MSPDYDRARLDAARDKYQSPSIADLSKTDMLGDIQWLLRKISRLEVVCAGLAGREIRTDPNNRYDRNGIRIDDRDNRYDRDGYYSK